MAHIVVYLQRTPQGLHPASAAALCLARDIASDRGATVTGVCAGDAGAFDRGMLAAAGRFGADVMLFCGPNGIDNIRERLNPVHILVPWTPEGAAAVEGLSGGPLIPRWLSQPHPPWGGADAITGIVAGALPWHEHHTELEAEYESDVDHVPLPPWMEQAAEQSERGEPPVFQVTGDGSVDYVTGSEKLDATVQQRLRALGAVSVPLHVASSSTTGTHVVLSAGAGPLPDGFAGRGPASRVILLPGKSGVLDASWSLADWVFPGAWAKVLDQLLGGPWETARG
jgi:hypothetical protein